MLPCAHNECWSSHVHRSITKVCNFISVTSIEQIKMMQYISFPILIHRLFHAHLWLSLLSWMSICVHGHMYAHGHFVTRAQFRKLCWKKKKKNQCPRLSSQKNSKCKILKWELVTSVPSGLAPTARKECYSTCVRFYCYKDCGWLSFGIFSSNQNRPSMASQSASVWVEKHSYNEKQTHFREPVLIHWEYKEHLQLVLPKSMLLFYYNYTYILLL